MTAKLALLEEWLEFDDIVRYRQLGRAVHEQRVKERGGGGGSEQKREGDKGGGGFFGWFQKRDEAATRAAEMEPVSNRKKVGRGKATTPKNDVRARSVDQLA